MTENVELVEQNAGLRSEARGREAKGFPHVHHRKSQAGGFSRAEPGIELLQARPGAISTAEPGRTLPRELADHDAVGLALLDRDLVDPDDAQARRPWLQGLGSTNT